MDNLEEEIKKEIAEEMKRVPSIIKWNEDNEIEE